MRHQRRDSGHLMLISPQRVFYAGLLGRPRGRSSGAFHIYAAIEGTLSLAHQGRDQAGVMLAVVPPYLSHTVESDHRSVICVTVEPETVPPGTLEQLARRIEGPEGGQIRERFRAAYARLRDAGQREPFTTAEFDTMLFGRPLPARTLDPRIAGAVERLTRRPDAVLSAASCAAAASLSQSRFLHLFKDETGVSFRAFRAWKRARHLLHFVNEEINFAHLAQDIGYPDSTHFSHSIRRFYGLQPRAIFTGSRDLAIWRSDPETRPRQLQTA